MHDHTTPPIAPNHWAMAFTPHKPVKALASMLWASPTLTPYGATLLGSHDHPQGHLAQAAGTTARRPAC